VTGPAVTAKRAHPGLRVIAVAAAILVARPGPGWSDAAFEEWVRELEQEARQRRISATTLRAVLPTLQILPRALELQRRQPEVRLSWAEYLRRVVPAARVVQARRNLDRHAAPLAAAGERYGVQPRFIVALWGIESDFGRNTGDTPVLNSLATLAYAGSRRDYFRRELLEALAVVDAGDVRADRMLGSWAGALGQCQFMPSNYRRLAVDGDGDGRRDIWGTPADVFASIARFLSAHGWRDDQTWGRQVRLPPGFDRRLAGPDVRMRLSRWQALGVRRADGRDLPRRDLWSSMVLPDGAGGSAYVVYDDFEVLLKWNRSTHFALAVGHLADRLR